MFGHDNSNKSDDNNSADTSSIWQPDHSQDDSAPGLPTDLPSKTDLPTVNPDESHIVKPLEPSEDKPSAPDSAPSGDLASIKQQALQQLGPLVGNLDQPPEEKFKTTMMMIQASDDQSLIKTAYDAAQTIPDEKARAQALLDIINEINYFTQKKDS